ncbi:uncharacterized protein MONBRDRAFT_24973 [Monosiga brevicollis MX1]|uniref:DH domain-containing protein n=1 Tax=Monosiga brevicollis TaxID=81824 RepID=A9UYB1_MONBE|nr:uncharacterized protein MONBRDRAFT_24973 [Monosiga brevicollis MX1]EDQ89990.1 predicted protein [Monosiga brevicollis MX1]|eukprot:XP_001745412.1 hypothetical protein [Monosiga brevicollis MX1]
MADTETPPSTPTAGAGGESTATIPAIDASPESGTEPEPDAGSLEPTRSTTDSPVAKPLGMSASRPPSEMTLPTFMPLDCALPNTAPVSASDTRRWSVNLPAWMKMGRRKATSELLATEEQYVNDLDVLVNEYMTALPAELVSDEEILLIFINLPALLAFHQQFLSDMVTASTDPKGVKLAQLILDKVEELTEHYQRYCGDHSRSITALVTKLQSQKSFQVLLNLKQSQLNRPLALKDDLLKPVQRVMRYHLLLGEQLKQSRPEEPGYASLSLAVDAMKKMALDINTHARLVHLMRLEHGDIHIARTIPLRDRLSSLACDYAQLGELRDEISDVVFYPEGKDRGKGSTRWLIFFSKAILSLKAREGTDLSVKEMYDLGMHFASFADRHSLRMSNGDGNTADAPLYVARNFDLADRLAWLCQPEKLPVAIPSPHRGKAKRWLTGRDRLPSSSAKGEAAKAVLVAKQLDQQRERAMSLEAATLLSTLASGGGRKPSSTASSLSGSATRPLSLMVTSSTSPRPSISNSDSIALEAEESTTDDYAIGDYLDTQERLRQAVAELQAELDDQSTAMRELLDDLAQARKDLALANASSNGDNNTAASSGPATPHTGSTAPTLLDSASAAVVDLLLKQDAEQIQQLRRQQRQMQRQNTTLQAQADATKTEKDELSAQNTVLEERVAELEAQQAAREAELEARDQEIARLREQVTASAAQLAAAEQARTTLQQNVSKLEARNQELRREVADEFAKREHTSLDSQAELSASRAELSASQEKILQLESQLQVGCSKSFDDAGETATRLHSLALYSHLSVSKQSILTQSNA